MYAVTNSLRALVVALIPLAVVHGAFLAMALMGTQTEPPQMNLPAPDKIVIYFGGRLALDGILLFTGHLLLRQSAMFSRLAYALMGGAMIATSYLVALRNGFLLVPPSRGSEITFGLLPTAAGMLAGFLYGQFAGLVSIADAQRSDGDERALAPRTFSGPVRVRSSVAAFIIAATVPAGLTAVLISMLLSLFFPFYLGGGVGPVFAAALPAQSFLMLLMATIVPSTIFILGVHHIARAFGRNRGIEYAGIGSLLGGLCVVLLAPLMPLNSIFMLLAFGIVFGAIMGALYRRFAGIEPVPLPEIVIATDEAALVDADHPSRHQHGVILTN